MQTQWGDDHHPNLATQAAMAAELETEIEAGLGWQPLHWNFATMSPIWT